MQGSIKEILLISIVTLIAIVALGGGLWGFLFGKISLLEKVVLIGVTMMVINPELIIVRWTGIVIMGIILIKQVWKRNYLTAVSS